MFTGSQQLLAVHYNIQTRIVAFVRLWTQSQSLGQCEATCCVQLLPLGLLHSSVKPQIHYPTKRSLLFVHLLCVIIPIVPIHNTFFGSH